MAVYLGIDPGKSGGLALISHYGDVLEVEKMPADEAELLELIKTWRRRASAYPAGLGENVVGCLERVSSMKGWGGVSTFTFGKHYGAVWMALLAAGISFDVVTPRVWQDAMTCRTKGDKNITKDRATRLFGKQGIPVTHATADALLIAEYARRRYVVGRFDDRSAGRTTNGKAKTKGRREGARQ